MRPGFSAAQIIVITLVATIRFGDALVPRTQIGESYDFIVVGGGLAGLVLGSRLSEDTNHTVLVLESGGNGDDYRERIVKIHRHMRILTPLWTTPLNWAFWTVPQQNAANREIYWPRGKVLGGENEINAWQGMLGDMDGAENWSWDAFYAAMKKSETFAPPIDAVIQEADITWNASNHGTTGPICASYPGLTFPQVGQWSMSCENIGIDISGNMYDGQNWGAEVSTSTINPQNWTRSYSRTGYLDPLPDRGNYDVLANAHVTRILFDSSSPSDNLLANAVEYTPDDGTTTLTVKVNKEVIIAGGSIGSPAILLHSGVGPKDVLSSAGVDLVSELPGVGQHLQDHFSATVTWNVDVETAGSTFYDDGSQRNNPLFLSYVDSAVAYVNTTTMYGSQIQELQTNILAQMDEYTPNTTYDAGVIAGYKAIYNTTASKIFNSPTGQIELLFMNSDGSGDIGITAALQHPYSHGRIYINSSNPMDYPVIDPNYLDNPAGMLHICHQDKVTDADKLADYEILRDGLKLARQLGETEPLSSSFTSERSPGSSVQTDEEWEDWLRGAGGTEYHPSSSCAMLPREQGGVVDANLRVYGLANVRVADASVPPIALSTHLMASTYGLAEQASTIIRDFWDRPSSARPSSSSTPTTESHHTTDTGSLGSGKSNQSSNGNVNTPLSLWISLLVAAHALVAFNSPL
ncbi:CAZyme family AA3 [Penicillium lagena]|uniref:CAZyme family AA3 n=1 Tax=Penicillium lagena TaxID=94218 RepID=UPI002541320B|nr:CAZyme family AA3 [Penicillium lagena]KAJ5611192.1 CAZyme family AA3 [Penicillium lagena]